MESLTALAKPLLTVGKALIPLVKRLQAEHRAGADFANVKSALLDAVLDDTLNRLEDIEAHVCPDEVAASRTGLNVRPAADTKIVDAWVSANSGDVVGGLARLRNLDTLDDVQPVWDAVTASGQTVRIGMARY